MNFVDYESAEFQTWRSKLPDKDQELLMSELSSEELGALPDSKLERRGELLKRWHQENLLTILKERGSQQQDNGNGKATHEQKLELTDELTKEVNLSEISEILSTSIKKDDAAKQITFLAMLLAQTNSSQINIGYQAESSAGKSYVPIELSNYFPESEVSLIA